MSLRTSLKTTDAVFSKLVRHRAKDSKGKLTCVTCRVKKPLKEMHAGHYVGRRHRSLRFDHRNVHPQCPSCNVFNEGAKDSYALFLIRTYGVEILEQLAKDKERIKKYTETELSDMRVIMREELKDYETIHN